MSLHPGRIPNEIDTPRRERLFTRDFVLACLITFTSFTSFYLLLATLPLYLMEIGGSVSEIGLIIGVFGAISLILRPFVGRETDVRGKGPFISAGIAILAIASSLYTLARSVPLLLGLRVLHGIGWASFTTATSALVADLAPRSSRGEAMGTFSSAMDLGISGGSVVWGFVAQALGYQAMYIGAGFVAVLALAIFLVGTRRSAVPPSG